METVFESKYYVDGKVHRDKKKNGLQNTFKHIPFMFLDFEVLVFKTMAYLQQNGVNDLMSRDAYEAIYIYHKLKEKEV